MKKLLIVSILAMSTLTGCDFIKQAASSRIHRVKSIGQQHVISQYSGGQLVNQWVSKGQIVSERHSDGYYFYTIDGSYIEVSGDLVIERINKQ